MYLSSIDHQFLSPVLKFSVFLLQHNDIDGKLSSEQKLNTLGLGCYVEDALRPALVCLDSFNPIFMKYSMGLSLMNEDQNFTAHGRFERVFYRKIFLMKNRMFKSSSYDRTSVFVKIDWMLKR